MVYYLKINRQQEYIFKNVGYWVDIVSSDPGAKVYLICDKQELAEQIKERIDMSQIDIEFIESDRLSEDLVAIVEKTCNAHWQFAAYAHLTTFLHAEKNGIEKFWNIDADDTCFCLKSHRVMELLKEAERVADRDGRKAFSLDMWTTKTWGEHWSFGITYINNDNDWIGTMKNHLKDKDFLGQNEQPYNVDGYFSYLKSVYPEMIGTFYAENLRFIHYADDFFKRPWCSGMFHWRDGRLRLPVLKDCFDLYSIGDEEIAPDVVGIDIGVTDAEAYQFLINHTHKDDHDNIIERLTRRRESYYGQ